MNRYLSTMFGVAWLCVVAAAASSCSAPTDVIAVGELCIPEDADCPAAAQLHRREVGGNALEFVLHSSPDTSSTSAVAVRITTDEERTLPEPRERTETGETILFESEYAVGPGEELRERLGSYELTVASRLEVHLECTSKPCDHFLEYWHFSTPVECTDDEVCSRGEICEQAYGRCADCTEDAHCEGDTSCDRETGRCFAGDTTGCSSTSAPVSPWNLVLGFAIGGLLLRRRNLRRWALASVCAGAVLWTAPLSASAGSGASVNAGGGLRVLTGDAGDLTHPGWGISINQQLRWHRVASSFQLATNSFGLTEGADTERGRITGYSITLGPRVFFPLPLSLPPLEADRPFELFTSVEYTRWSIAENHLAGVTGLDLNYHALGPATGLIWYWRGLELTARLAYTHIFGWPGGMFTFDLQIGFAP